MKSQRKQWAWAALGVALAAAGLYGLRTGAWGAVLPYVCIGVGCGLFGHGMGALVARRAVAKAPEVRRQLEIAQNDERNVALASLAKGKAFDRMTFLYGALMVSFALMEVDLAAILLLVFAYLLVHGLAIFYRFWLEKEM